MSFLVFLAFVFVIGVPILAIVALAKSSSLKTRVENLENEVFQLKAMNKPVVPVVEAVKEEAIKPAEKIIEKEIEKPVIRQVEVIPPSSNQSFEEMFGAKLPVWGGAIAFIFAGFFLVKYSIENGLLDERVRITLGILFGSALIIAGDFTRLRPRFTRDWRIPHALTGAGIVVLYGVCYAATNLYHMITPATGFIVMAFISAFSIAWSLRAGLTAAYIGLIGGLVTPLLISTGSANYPALLTYLFALCGGTMILARVKLHEHLLISALAGAGIWVALLFTQSNVNALYIAIFVITILALTLYLFKEYIFDGEFEGFTLPNIGVVEITLAVSAGLLALYLTGKLNEITLAIAWGAMVSLTLAVAYMNLQKFWVHGFVVLLLSVFIGFTRFTPSYLSILMLGLPFIAAGIYGFFTHKRPDYWALLGAIAFYLTFMLAYNSFKTPLFGYAAVALLCAFVTISIVQNALKQGYENSESGKNLIAIFVLLATALITTTLAIIFDGKVFTAALSAEVAMLALLDKRFDIKPLRVAAMIIAGVFAFYFANNALGYAWLAVSAFINSPEMQSITFTHIFFSGLTALDFAIAAYYFGNKKHDLFVKICEILTAILIAHVIYEIFYRFLPKYFLTAIYAPLLALIGLVTFKLAKLINRKSLYLIASGFIVVAIAKAIGIDLLFENPLFRWKSVGAMPILNALLFTFAAPALWLLLAEKQLPQKYSKPLKVLALVFGFTFITLTIRHFYAGEILCITRMSNAEIYTYSLVWLLCGLGLLFFGTLKQNQEMRVASLAVMLLVVAKVFFYDAAALNGLMRVLSFFGLGLSLMGLGWFYSRFVFKSLSHQLDQ